MMRRPFDLDIIGKNLGTQQDWKPDNLKAGGSFAGQGPVDATPRLYVRSSGTGPLFVVAGKPLERRVRAVAEGSLSHRRRGAGADPVRAGIDAGARPRDRPPRRCRKQARGDGDDGRAHRPAQPPQVRPCHRHRMAPRHAPEDAGRAADDRCRSLQGLQRHVRPPGRRPGAGRHRHLHLRFGAPRRRLRRALWRRGIRRAAAGHVGHRRLQDRRDHPRQGAGLVRRRRGIDRLLRHRQPRAHQPAWTGRSWSPPPTRRSMPPKPAAATSRWWRACRSCRWWREARRHSAKRAHLRGHPGSLRASLA